ncbi:unnamed protein product [Sphagnum jensenii]|uniref:Uncharacterized protein n=1 Tax=Sphagnum jensenii TaxID=128206 RepID=A0ABP1BGA9_9BRYO
MHLLPTILSLWPLRLCKTLEKLLSHYFLSGNLLGKEGKKEIRAPEVPVAPNNPARCRAPDRIAQAISEKNDGKVHKGNRQRSPLKIILMDIPEQASSGADQTAGRFPPPQESSQDRHRTNIRRKSVLQDVLGELEAPPPDNFCFNNTPYKRFLPEDEEGTTSTRKLATVEWSGLSLSFSKYNPNFEANAQGAEALLTHAIKVQFPDWHDQFRNERTLTIMASKLGEVLDIEAANCYMKRPAGPMVTIEVKDITKLAGYMRIPSMAEGAAFTNTIRQKILYSGLPNQC